MTGDAMILGINDLSVTDFLIAKPSIQTVADLKGKTVIYSKGTVEELVLALALQGTGLTLNDLKLVNIPDFATQVTAYLSGQADAIAASAPFSNTVLQKDPSSHTIFSDATGYPKFVIPDSWVTSPSFDQAHPDTVDRFMWAVGKIQNWCSANIDACVSDVSAFSKQTVDVIKQNAPPDNAKLLTAGDLATKYQDGTVKGWYQALAQVFLESGRITTIPDQSTYLDLGPAINVSTKLDQATY
jgi:NitT/TauT family transport system substrate-binding protein